MKTVIRSCAMPMLLLFTLLAASCSKEKSSQSPEDQTEILQTRNGGVVDDDSALQANVPVIVSSGFLKSGSLIENIPISRIAAKGKPDAIPPTVSIISPANGASVSGTISVLVSATDNVKVTSVTLSVDGTAKASSTITPFTNVWNSGTVPNGNHTLTVTAKDGKGNSSSSSIQVSVNNVTVGDITAPSVNITSPGDGSSYDANTTLNISTSASDNVAVTSLNISIDGTVVASSSNSSHSYSWNTSTAGSGIHTISSTAKDAAGNQTIKSVTVTINTVVIEPPSNSGVRLTMPPVGNQGSEGSCVAFAVGYAARSAEQYYRSGASSYSNATNVFSPEFLYNQIKFNSDCNSGTAMQTALDFIKLNGIPTFQTMPYSSSNGCSVLPTTSQITEALNYKIGTYSKLYSADKAAIKAMISQNHPVIINVIADNSFISAKAGFIWKTYSGSGSLPHCIVICGYDDAKNAYLIMNSWGTGWGDAGYSWIDYDFFTTRTGTYCYAIN
ncbi:Ig-like domain-containing protein [Lacibacter sp. H375]|uniref:Ig-like domain-containing protein n=1 Tax=Lacibacter sp. H375 TaxID=3133424 RepID=UPI0030C2FBC4